MMIPMFVQGHCLTMLQAIAHLLLVRSLIVMIAAYYRLSLHSTERLLRFLSLLIVRDCRPCLRSFEYLPRLTPDLHGVQVRQ